MLINTDQIRLEYRTRYKRANYATLLRLLRAKFRRLITGKKLMGIQFALTYRCQCECVHCCVAKYKRDEPELSTEEVFDILDQLEGANVVEVMFFGGEAILREDIVDIIEHASDSGIITHIETNGIALSASLLSELRDAGLNHCYISIDHSVRAVHDELRQYPGCFDAAIKAVENCRQVGIPCTISNYTSKENVESGEVGRVIELGKNIEATAVRVIQPIFAGRWLNETCVGLDDVEKEKVRRLFDPGFVYMEDIRNMYRVSDEHPLGTCDALFKHFFYISPYGDVQPCPFQPISFGTTREEPLKDIIYRMHRHTMFKEEHDRCPVNYAGFRNKYFTRVKDGASLPVRV